MPNDVRTRFECSTPILSVADMAASLRYYEGVLGFTNAEWGDEDFTCVTRDGASIYLCAKHQGRGGTWVRIGVEAVDRNFHFGFQTENSIHPFRPPAIPQSCLEAVNSERTQIRFRWRSSHSTRLVGSVGRSASISSTGKVFLLRQL
jgi:catechol 2,3-dioxygenase-like lactoylglutathione lyase family enzyme